MQATAPEARRRDWRLLTRIAAVLVLGLIGADLGDGGCDPLPLHQGDPALLASASESPDACADFCVPDCFCCTTSAPAVAEFSLPAAGAASAAPSERAESLVAGVQRVIEHIPITAR